MHNNWNKLLHTVYDARVLFRKYRRRFKCFHVSCTYYIFSSFNTIFFVESILHGNDVHRAYTFILPIRSCRNQPTNQPTATSTIRTECVIIERSMTFIEYTLLRFFYPEHSKSVMKWNQKQKAKPKPESNRPDQHKLMPLVIHLKMVTKPILF